MCGEGAHLGNQQVFQGDCLRALAQTMLPAQDGSLVRILQLQQVQHSLCAT